MSAKQKVSVVIPAWNAERYLEEALESVVGQTVAAHEIIVVDDGSTDATAAICGRSPDVRYVHQPNSGAGAARNLGVALSAGDVLAFLDADDLWLPEKTAQQLSLLDDPDVDAVFGSGMNFVSPDRAEELSSLSFDATIRAAYIPSAMMIKRHVFDAHGSFSTGGSLTDWVEWYLRFLDSGARVALSPTLVVRRRIHGANATMNDPAGMKAYVRMVKSSIDRRRTQNVGSPSSGS